MGRLLSATSRLGVETFAFDPASNLLDNSVAEIRRPLDQDPKRNTLMDNLLREYAGIHYEYDERGNQIRRWHNGQQSQMRWDLFDRLVRFEDNTLSVDYTYDPLGRRIHKYSNAHHKHRPEAGSHWNQNEQARKQRELGCGFTLFGWDGDTLAWESSPAQADGTAGKTVHYLYEPGTFVPVAQAMRHQPIRLLAQPNYEAAYDIDQDPLWTHTPQALPIDVLAWYQCDHLGTPQELTDPNGQIAWSAQYKAWGEVKEQRSEWAQREGLTNPIRFQGQYHDHETGLHYNRYRYYDPRVGRFISKDPISYAGGLNLYAYAPNPVGWVDPLGLVRIKNAIEGDRRHQEFNAKIKEKYPNATIQCECYLRDAAGKSVKDPKTEERRRVDTVVIENGKAQTFEVTSTTADKTKQVLKEINIRSEGGIYIRDRSTKDLIPVNGVSEIVRIP